MINKIYVYLFSILLLLSINLPTVYKEVKIVVLLLLLVIVGYKLVLNKMNLRKDTLSLGYINLMVGLGFFINGLIRGTPGAFPMLTVFILWPTLYILLISVNKQKIIFKSFDKVFLFSAYFIPLYGIYFLLGKANVLPSFLFVNIFPEDSFIGIGLREGAVEVSLLNFSSLLFLTPYIFAKFLLSITKLDKIKYGIAIVLLIAIIFLSGRRAIFVVEIFSLFLIYVLSFFFTSNIRAQLVKFVIILFIISIILSTILLNYYDVDFTQFFDNLINGFDFESSDDYSTQIRSMQFISLFNGWMDAPFFGNGLGAVASMIRNENMPWAYELTYMYILFQVGIVGFIFYTLLILWLIYSSIKLLKNREHVIYIFPYLIGFLGFMVGNTSNPYLLKFDYMWIIFIPVMYIMFSKIHQKKVL